MDGDDPGKNASVRLQEKLRRFSVEIKTPPDNHDPNSYLQTFGAEQLAAFIRDENKTFSLTAENIRPEPDGFTVRFGLRKYRIMGLEKGSRKLKATVRLEHGGKLHVDTLDFYSARARKNLAQDICRVFNESPDTIYADITKLMLECENAPDRELKDLPEESPQMTETDRNEAEAFGRSPDLVEKILSDFQACGLIGEDANKLLGYIAMTSRKRKEPLSVQILSSSGAGKTALQDAIVRFCPSEDLVKLTSLSGKALFYKEQTSLKHKVLALEEDDGAEDASYAIRSLISSGVLTNETTIKDLSTGKLTTMENRVEGPTAVFYTTTNPDVDPETKSRFFVTGIDESREQTRKILAFQREKHVQDEIEEQVKVETIIRKHQNFQRLLQPLGVKNPYSSRLAYGDDRLQGRRDQPKYLNLIKSVAFLRQMQKEIKSTRSNGNPHIEVEPEDIRIANQLTNEILGRSLDELSRPGRDLLILLDEMIDALWAEAVEKDHTVKRVHIPFTRRDIRKFTGWSNYRVHTHLKELVNLEYVFVESGKNGMSYCYRLAYEGQGKDGSRFILGLTDPSGLNL